MTEDASQDCALGRRLLAPQSAFEAAQGTARAFTSSLAALPAADTEVEAYLGREVKFDPDVWIVEIEDRAGRNFLDIVAA